MLKYVERLLLIGGAAALLWCAGIATSTAVVQRLARETLRATPPVAARSSSTVDAASLASPATPPRVVPGSILAELSIPRVGVDAMVFQGSDDRTLRFGLGHLEDTPLPGEPGNVAIAGHRDTFFRPLEHVRVGDDIWLDTADARVHYRVSWLRVVSSSSVSVVGPTMEATLTLVTCYPFRFIGPAPDRFVVRAQRVDDPAAE